jgi:competence protein ComEC
LIWALLNLKGRSQSVSEKPKQIDSVQQHISKTRYPLFLRDGVRKLRDWLNGFNDKKKQVEVVAIVVSVLLLADLFYWLHYRFWHNDLRVTVLDVGQGSSALLEIPGGARVLIDGGGFPDNTVFDVGAGIVAPFLLRKKIRTVDFIVLSHPSSDHMNGLLYIAENFNVKCVWSNGQIAETRSYRNFISVIEKERIPMPLFMEFPRIQNIGGVKLNILHPPTDFIAKSANERWRNLNNNSIVLKVCFGSKSFLFPGDIMAEAEKELTAHSGDTLKSTILISPHHGSKSSSTPEFLEKVDPECVIISSGWKASGKFPHPSVLKRYSEYEFKVFRTDTHGALSISTDGRRLKIRPTIDGLSRHPLT